MRADSAFSENTNSLTQKFKLPSPNIWPSSIDSFETVEKFFSRSIQGDSDPLGTRISQQSNISG
jgi:hypothetical protein